MKAVLDIEKIDEPIRDVVLKLNELGFKTTFSCAGFDYDGHKGGLDDKGRFIFMIPSISFKCSLKKIRLLLEALRESGCGGWKIELADFNQYELLYGPAQSYSKESSCPNEWKRDSWKELRKALWWLKFGLKEIKRRRKICPGGPVRLWRVK